MANVDDAGVIINDFHTTTSTAGEPPSTTWAMHLTDDQLQFRFICFDLDAKGGRPDVDAGRASLWLYDLGIPHLVAESGPSGGRHVWIALAEGVPATTVATIGRLAQAHLPSLDLSPISNAATGAVRPPGAPHRHGGHSRVLDGHVDLLRWPTVDEVDVNRLLRYLVELTGGYREPAAPVHPASVATDNTGMPYLQRTRPAAVTAPRISAVDRPGGDASALLASAMTRYVHAGMRFAEMLAIAPNNPALEHAYSERTGPLTRVPRSSASTAAILRRQWARAVAFVAEAPDAFTGDDPTFDDRAAAVVAAVDAIQQRADAAPGRWGRTAHRGSGGRYTDRLVLDAVCLVALETVKTTIDASGRYLSGISGVCRETARTALIRLQEDGWIEIDTAGEGTNATRWKLRELSTGKDTHSWAHVSPPPEVQPAAALRIVLLQELRRRFDSTTHDVFAAPHSLGRTAGRLYAQLQYSELTSVIDLCRSTGLSGSTVRRQLHTLAAFNLVERTAQDWHRAADDHRTATAEHLHVAGYLENRRTRYAAERQMFAWWRAELEMRNSHRTTRRRRRRHPSQLSLVEVSGAPIDYPLHPKRRDGRADYAAARRAVTAGIFEPTTPPSSALAA